MLLKELGNEGEDIRESQMVEGGIEEASGHPRLVVEYILHPGHHAGYGSPLPCHATYYKSTHNYEKAN